jgi:LuxR family transcriptional regulator, maltose regulon positive regulatory protein
LLLDDYHAITSPRIQQTMTFFLAYLPASIHVIIITRSDPPFSLAGLRARNDLCDVRSSDLRFSQEETSAFLQQTLPVPLAPEIVQRVDAHLEGWAAGLRLLLMALRESATPREIEPLLRVFAGGQHALQDYFLTEVFNTQPEPLRRFLLQTSVLARLTGSLCAAITGERDSERMLETVARANLFLEPLNSSTLDPSPAQQWYRYHGLFAEVMRAEARRRLGEEKLRELSAHASRWYEAHHLYAEAVESAFYAQDYPRAAVLIERILREPHAFYQANEYHTLYTWLEQLPGALLAQYPALCLGYARALLYRADSWRLSQATLALLEKLFQMAEESYRAEHDLPRLGEVFAFRSLAAWRQDDAIQAASYARQALTWLSEEQQTWRGLSLSVVGKAELLYHGRVDAGRRVLEEAYTLCEATDNRHFRLSRATQEMLILARWHLAQGRREAALQLLQDLLPEAQETGRRRSAFEAQALLALAYAAHEQQGQARQILLTLLAQTCTEGYLRLFLDEGEAMAVLLRTLVLHIREQPLLAYLQDIMRAFPGSQGTLATSPATLLAEPLSSQELRVLRLRVPGRSNAEIARELVVSVNTVRTHMQNIYRKLDAHNRAAAVEVARQLHLIS